MITPPLPRHGKCYFCHNTLVNLKGSYRHANPDEGLECGKKRKGRKLIDELGHDLFYGKHRQIKKVDPFKIIKKIEKRTTKNDFVGKNCALCGTYPPYNHYEFYGEYLCESCAEDVYEKVKKRMNR